MSNPQPVPALPPARRVPPALFALVAGALSLGVGLSQARNDLRSDDWTYLDWAHANPGWASFLSAPPPFPYFRPLNALLWQLQGHGFGASPWPMESALLGLWGAALAFLFAIVSRRAGPLAALIAVTLALCTLELRDVPNWRSWITTAGGMAGLFGGLLLAARGRPMAALLLIAVGAGFKEGAWWQGAWALAALGELPAAGVALAAYVVHAGIAASWHNPGEIGVSHVLVNLPQVAQTLWGWGWPLPLLAVALLAPRAAWRDGNARMVLAAVAAMAPVLGFYLYSPYYLLEAALLLLLALLPPAAAAARRFPLVVWVAAAGATLLLAQPARWSDYHENVAWQAKVQVEGRALAARGAGATAAWAPVDDQGPCGLACRLLVYGGATSLSERPADGDALAECLVVRR